VYWTQILQILLYADTPRQRRWVQMWGLARLMSDAGLDVDSTGVYEDLGM